MAYPCMIGIKRTCDGCGSCGEERVVMRDIFDVEIFDGEEYYDIDGTILAKDSIYDWLDQYKKIGRL